MAGIWRELTKEACLPCLWSLAHLLLVLGTWMDVFWSPHWVFADYKIKYLEDPKNVYGPNDKIHSMSRIGFTAEHPEIVKWMSECKIE
jgi:hypothetical protein